MSSLTAGLGISQLHKLDKIIKLRQSNAAYISKRIEKIPYVQTPKIPNNYQHIFQLYSILLSTKNIRNQLHSFLLKEEIFSKIYFEPIHKTSFYRKKFQTQNFSLPVTENISERILTLPMYPNMTTEEKNLLINKIYEFFETRDFEN